MSLMIMAINLKHRSGFWWVRLAQLPRHLFYFLASANVIEGRPKRFQPIHAMGRGNISIKEGAIIGFFPSPGIFGVCYLEARFAGSQISIGKNTLINNGFIAMAEHSSIRIGDNCLIGVNVEILDSNFHGLNVGDRDMSKADWCAPVVLEDCVFIGNNVKILKGVTIGYGAVVANASVVVKDVEALSVVGGNPAKFLKKVSQ